MKTLSLVSLATLGLATAATAAPMLYEEQVARAEEALILTSPIAGIENSRWFDYRSDVGEAQKELVSDLRRASDLEDTRDAWEEYAHELKHERIDYIEDMAEKGYRQGTVTIVN
ncbi:hypothetical protein [Erythrobacter mangrovi]|uniref:DUF4148 domain-containing protein n=1 Tax=Erythrobacter mangrovi TaxID=2739433 RepID=A0A7D4B9K2_9SPHN|nr:hypothetical protein [Erythrobacter mangrovi]QKG70106.1 hypothetical protein HQR01_01265 [Erythrobacter mangrovi]